MTRSRVGAAALFLLFAACSKSTPGGPSARASLGLSDQRIRVGGWLRILPAEPCTFVLEEPDGGTLGADGFYRAPSVPGTFHVRATSTKSALAARITITVAPGTVRLLAGPRGAYGYRDGVGDSARFRGADPIAVDGAGHAFIGEDGHVRRLDLATREVTTLASVDGRVTSLAYARGALYFTLDNDTTIRTWSGGDATKVLTGTEKTIGLSDGPLEKATFSRRLYVASDGESSLYVADADNELLRRIDLASGTVSTLAGGGVNPLTGKVVDGVGRMATFLQTFAIAWDPSGLLWIGDRGGYAVRKIDVKTATVTTVVDGEARMPFAPPIHSVAADGAGHVYVGDALYFIRIDTATGKPDNLGRGVGSLAFDRDRLILGRGVSIGSLDPAKLPAAPVTILAGADLPDGDRGNVDGAPSLARFSEPSDLLFVDGHLLVDDGQNRAMREIDIRGGQVSTFFKTDMGIGPLLIDDRNGSLYFRGSSRVWQRFDLSTRTLTDDHAYDGDELVHIGPDGTRFVARRAASSVRVFRMHDDGSVDPVASSQGFPSMETDGVGHLFLSVKNTIHRIDLSTNSDAVIAGALGDARTLDGPPGVSRFRFVYGFRYDGRGGLLVLDGDGRYGADCVRKLDVVSGELTTVMGTPGNEADGVGPLPSTVVQARAITVAPGGETYLLEGGAVYAIDTGL